MACVLFTAWCLCVVNGLSAVGCCMLLLCVACCVPSHVCCVLRDACCALCVVCGVLCVVVCVV